MSSAWKKSFSETSCNHNLNVHLLYCLCNQVCTHLHRKVVSLGGGGCAFFVSQLKKKKRCDTQSKLPNIKYIQDIAHAYFDAQNVTEILV